MKMAVVFYVRHPNDFSAYVSMASLQMLVLGADPKIDLEIFIVEAQSHVFDLQAVRLGADPVRWMHPTITDKIKGVIVCDPPQGLAKELNMCIATALARASPDFVVCVGNDILCPPGWNRALVKPFADFRDCGVSTLACSDLYKQATPGAYTEGFWGPLMCFRPGWSFDEDYERLFLDTDLYMRMTREGLKAYRNHDVLVYHINKMTQDMMFTPEETQAQLQRGAAMFQQKHQDLQHTIIFRALMNGTVL